MSSFLQFLPSCLRLDRAFRQKNIQNQGKKLSALHHKLDLTATKTWDGWDRSMLTSWDSSVAVEAQESALFLHCWLHPQTSGGSRSLSAATWQRNVSTEMDLHVKIVTFSMDWDEAVLWWSLIYSTRDNRWKVFVFKWICDCEFIHQIRLKSARQQIKLMIITWN